MSEQRTSQPWAMRLAVSSAGELFRAAGLPIQAATAGDDVWVRGDYLTDELQSTLRSLPGERFAIGERNELLAPGKTVPTLELPSLSWQPLESMLQVQSSAAALCTNRNYLSDATAEEESSPEPRRSRRVPLRLRRAGSGDAPSAAGAVIVALETLARWVGETSDVRIECLRWMSIHVMQIAADDPPAHWRAMVVGAEPAGRVPLPHFEAIESESVVKFWSFGHHWIPLGQVIAPAIPLPEIDRALQLGAGDQCVWFPNGRCDTIRSENFRPMTRAGVRAASREAT